MIKSAASFSLKGQYRYETRRHGLLVESTPWRDNIILDQGLDMFGLTTVGFFLDQCLVSADIGSPTITDTAFSNIVATDAVNTCTRTNVGSPTYATEIITSYMYPTGTFSSSGAFIRQFGVGRAGVLFSKHRLVDSVGAPTELGVDNLTELTIYYKLTAMPVVTDVIGTVTLAGIDYDYTGRVAQVGSFMDAGITALSASPCSTFATSYISSGPVTVYPSTSVLGAVTGVPTGSGIALSNVSMMTQQIFPSAYVAGSFTRSNQITILPSAGNPSGGIGAILLKSLVFSGTTRTQCAHQYQFTPAIPKDATKTLSLTFQYDWGRS